MTQTPTDRMGYGGPEDDEIEDKSAEHKKDLEDLFYDVSKDLREDPSCEKQPEFRQQCLDKITPYINKWAQRSTRSPVPNFVHRVFERDVFFTDESGNELGVYFGKPVREFLLGLAIPVNLEQLAETSPSPGRLTALHRAIDQSSRGFAPLLCRLIKQGIQDGKLSKAKASGIISQKNAKNENCLHLALKKDLEVSEDLIELADYATFVQQSDNGNTPLHDALEFPAPVEAKIWEHRYLVPAPICETLARQVSVQDFAEDVRPDRHAEDLTCCNRCLEFDKKYTNLKRRRSKIICALIKKCPDSLALHNKMGRSPFSYHVLAREEFKRNNPDFFVRANQRKQAYKQLNIKTEAFERLNRRRSVNMETTRGGGQQRIAAQPGRGQAKSPLPYNAGQEEIFANVGRILKSTHSFELEGLARTPTWQDSGKSGEVQDCSQELSPDWFHLSQEVEELLWETAFKVGSYREARRCLFPLAVTEGTKDEFAPSEDEELHDVFIPTARVTKWTTDRYPHFKFCPTLAYVHLKVTPTLESEKKQLKTPTEQADWRENVSCSLEILFDWLTDKKRKGVERIIKLVVEDNEEFPCSESTIKYCLKKLKDVRYLDWRRPNMSIQTLVEANATNVIELWLYSNGYKAVLSSWTDQGGLQTLHKLRTVHLEAKPGMETTDANNDNIKVFHDKLNSWYVAKTERRASSEIGKDAPTALTKRRGPPKVIVDDKSVSSTGNSSGQGDSGASIKKSHPWLEKLQKLTKELKNTYSPGDADAEDENTPQSEDTVAKDYIKVALLDDGVDPEEDELGKFVSGRGFPKPSEAVDGSTQPESFQTAGPLKHGNRMAKLITIACPFVRLYVAKINAKVSVEANHHPSFDVSRAVEAILWAIRENVEVISMSWNVLLAENSQGMHDLREAIQKASTKGILLYCAASENNASTTGDEAWPAACRETISIGAANDNRGRRDYVGADAKFLFPSTHDGEDRGSSAATAVAAGLGSLILYCLKAKQCEELSSNLEKGRQVDQKEKHGSRRERQTDEKTGKIGQKEKQSLQQVSFAAGDDPRGMMLKVFGSLCPDKTSNYVDIDMLLGKGPISYGSITKHCEPHITKAGTQKRILLKASSGM